MKEAWVAIDEHLMSLKIFKEHGRIIALGSPIEWNGSMEWVFPTSTKAYAFDRGEAIHILMGEMLTIDGIIKVGMGYSSKITTVKSIQEAFGCVVESCRIRKATCGCSNQSSAAERYHKSISVDEKTIVYCYCSFTFLGTRMC